jgi:hypothetical protein
MLTAIVLSIYLNFSITVDDISVSLIVRFPTKNCETLDDIAIINTKFRSNKIEFYLINI